MSPSQTKLMLVSELRVYFFQVKGPTTLFVRLFFYIYSCNRRDNFDNFACVRYMTVIFSHVNQ